MSTDTTVIEPAGAGAGIAFTVASRPQRRFSNAQTVSNLAGATSFAPIQLPATGHVRRINLYFTAAMACASAGSTTGADSPWNLISGVTLTDATGQPILQPVSGYNLYLINKYLPTNAGPLGFNDPFTGGEFSYPTATATAGSATWRLSIDLEQDARTGYGCIPNLDSNASLQLKIDVAPYTVAFTGTTVSSATVSVRVEQEYWAPVGSSLGGVPVQTMPPGRGDFLETRFETQTVTAAAENTVNVTSRGGLIKGIVAVSRAAGARTAYASTGNVGLVYDNNAIDEGIPVQSFQTTMKRRYGFTDYQGFPSSYNNANRSYLSSLDFGVLAWNFDLETPPGNRDAWLSTRVGTQLQLKVTPGASATQMELITALMQVRDPAAFYGR